MIKLRADKTMQIKLIPTNLLIVVETSVGCDLQALSQRSPLLLVRGSYA
jgi:hypothetical protein